MDLENAATVFQVTRLTGASFIVSTPTRARRPFDASSREQMHPPCPEIRLAKSLTY
jgi:hypothetical protein